MKFKVVGLGEVLWDLLPAGRKMGGAPTNFACQAGALGADTCIISRVGQDADGREILARLAAQGVPTECVEVDPVAPTGTVSVHVDAAGQPQFTIHEHVAWDRLAGEANARRAMSAADAVCFGTLAQRSAPARAAIESLLQLARPEAWRILDVNLRQHYYSRELIESSLARANVLKVNDTELPRLSEFWGLAGDARQQLTALAQRWALRVVAYTRGDRGSLLLADGHWSDHPGIAVRVVDTVGAGDAFTAAMTLGLLAGWDLDTINQRANQIAAYVASCAGATPTLPETLRAPFLESDGISAAARPSIARPAASDTGAR
jgi:fructokinase